MKRSGGGHYCQLPHMGFDKGIKYSTRQNSSSFFRFSERGNGTCKRPFAPSIRTDAVGNRDNLLWEEPVRSRFSAVAKTCLSPLAIILQGGRGRLARVRDVEDPPLDLN